MGKIDRKKWNSSRRKIARDYVVIPLDLVHSLAKQKVSRAALMSLLAIFYYADNSGKATPSLESIVEITSLSKRQVQRGLKELEKNRILERQLRPTRTTLYKII